MQPFLVKALSPGGFQRKSLCVSLESGSIWINLPGKNCSTWTSFLLLSLESFIIAAAWDKYETTNHPYRIKITQCTKVIEPILEPEIFSRDNTVLSDVAGLLMIVNGYRSVEYESRAKVPYSLIGIARCW